MKMKFKYGEGWVVAPEGELEYAGVIAENRSWYDVSMDGSYIGRSDDIDEAEAKLIAAMEMASYWPSCYYVNERGNTTLLILEED